MKQILLGVIALAAAAAPGPVELSYHLRPGQSVRIKLDYSLGDPADSVPGEMVESYDAVAEVKNKDDKTGSLAIRFEQFERTSKVPGHSKVVTWSAAGLKHVEDGKVVRNVPGENDVRFDMFRRALLAMDFRRHGNSMLPEFAFELGRPPPDLTFFVGSLELAMPNLPAHTVKVGDKWEGESLVPPPSPNSLQPPMKLTYVLESMDAKSAVIRMKGSRETTDPSGKYDAIRAKDDVSGKARVSLGADPSIDANFEIRISYDDKSKKTTNMTLRVAMHLASGGSSPAKVTKGQEADGSSIDHSIVIHAGSEMEGVQKESVWLKDHYPGFKRIKQNLHQDESHKRSFDVIEIETAEGAKKSIYFDVTDFYGKLK